LNLNLNFKPAQPQPALLQKVHLTLNINDLNNSKGAPYTQPQSQHFKMYTSPSTSKQELQRQRVGGKENQPT
jgi:hypothetical protein